MRTITVLWTAVFGASLSVPAAEESPRSSPEESKPGEPATAAPAGGGIAWARSFDEARAASAAARKPLLIDFGAEWCGFCKKLDRETFTEEAVIRFVKEHFIAVKVDTDKKPDLAKKFEVRGLPTLVFLSPDGAEVQRIEGFRPPDAFLAEARKSVDSSAALVKLEEAAKANPADIAAQRAYARSLFATGDRDGAIKVLTAALERAENDGARAGIQLDLGDALLQAGKRSEALAAYEKAAALAPAELGEERDKATLSLARVAVSLKDHDAALRALDGLLGKGAVKGKDRLEALFLRGYEHSVKKDAEKALADLRTARDEDPEGRWGTRAGLIIDLVEAK